MRKLAALILCFAFILLLTPQTLWAAPGYVMGEPDHVCKTNCYKFGLKTGQTHYDDGGSDLYVDIIQQPARYDRPHQFIVVQYEKKLQQTFSTLNAAISYAKKWHAARVFEDVTCQLRWDNRPAKVYQTSHLLKTFASTTEAIEYAKRWDHARVVDIESKAIVWHDYPNTVYQYSHLLKSVSNMNDAVKYARLWTGSYILDGLTNDVIWVNRLSVSAPANFIE